MVSMNIELVNRFHSSYHVSSPGQRDPLFEVTRQSLFWSSIILFSLSPQSGFILIPSLLDRISGGFVAPPLTVVRKRSLAEAESAARSTNTVIGVIDGIYTNPSEASTATGKPKTTVYHRAKGSHTRQEAHTHRQALSPDEENALVSWIERLTAAGHPVKHSFICELTEEATCPA